MNPKLKSLTSIALLLSLASQAAFAGAGARDGNGSGDPAIAYTDEQAEQIKEHLNLDYLKLTPSEIRKRDRKLQPIYDYYREATLQKVAEYIEDTFGANVYHFQDTENGLYKPSLDDKASVMDSAIRFYTGFDVNNTPFDHISASVLSGKGKIYVDNPSVELKLVSGDEKKFGGTDDDDTTPFALMTYKSIRTNYGVFWDSKEEGLRSSLQNHLFEFPTLDRFLSAIKASNLKGLDATLVFTSGNAVAHDFVYDPNRWGRFHSPSKDQMGEYVSYRVVYPTFSNLAPIPQPILFISSNASEEDMTQMLQVEAPKVYAYNQLFNQQMLPQAEQMAKMLEKYPDVMRSLKDAMSSVEQSNMEERLYDGFLTVTFGMLAAGLAPVTLAAMLASPVLHPLLISACTTVVIVP